MKYLKVICAAAVLLAAVLLFFPVVTPRSGFTRGPQHLTSEMEMRSLISNLIAYAEDHCDELPPSIAVLSDESFEQYGFGGNLFAKGNHVQFYAPLDIAPSPLLAKVFSDHDYFITRDHRHLLVFERPGLWDDHTVAYLDLNLSGKWARDYNGMRFTRLTERQFAQLVAKIETPAQAPSQAEDLVFAAKSGNSKKAQLLLGRGISVNDEDHDGWTPLTAAAQANQPAMVELLLSRGAQINKEDDFGVGRTALMRASALGYASVVDALLTHGADIGIKREDGNNALMDALPNQGIVQKLINAGANINEETENEWSPLIAACSSGYAETARLLIEHGANVKRDILDALNRAARNGQAEAIDVLLLQGINIDKKLLGDCESSAYSSPQSIKRLIAAGADPNAKCDCPGGRTVLMVAALNGCTESVTVLIAAGANLNAKDDNGYTVLDLALADSKSEWLAPESFERAQILGIVDILRAAGAKPSGLRVEWPEP